MKCFALIAVIFCGCSITPVASAPIPTPDCQCKSGERCPDLEAEIDRSTPGCTTPEALQPLEDKRNTQRIAESQIFIQQHERMAQ